MSGTSSDISPRASVHPERPSTPVSAMSSSSEEDFTASPLDSYDIIKNNQVFSKTSRHNLKGKDHIPFFAFDVIPDLENQAKAAASNLSKIMRTLNQDLKAASSSTLQTVKIYEGCVDDVGGTLDESMRTMYALMAKVEELDKKMEPVYDLAKQVGKIKTLLESFEQLCK